MGKNGKLLNLNSDSPKYGNKSLVTKEQENELKRRKITFSFSYFNLTLSRYLIFRLESVLRDGILGFLKD